MEINRMMPKKPMKTNNEKIGLKIEIHGLVQGVGFRPFVSDSANIYGISGNVRNSGGIVTVEIFGERADIEKFISHIMQFAPEGSRIDEIKKTSVPFENLNKFEIIKSGQNSEKVRSLPPDIAMCRRCEAELYDKANRRYLYPFISCTICGPRFGIMEKIPYDRENTSMDIFQMCPECKTEYSTAGNPRTYSQTNSCPNCGPKLKAYTADKFFTDKALDITISMLKDGKAAAIKNVGGYHFAFSAFSENAALRIRKFKSRENKPFAVMFASIDEAAEYCEMSETEKNLLLSPIRPILLLKKKKEVGKYISENSGYIGAMLPCDPLQSIILKEISPLVMTSANKNGEPMLYRDDVILERMSEGFPDVCLTHDREIITPLDDSIFHVSKLSSGREIVRCMRRARGIVPEPIKVDFSFEKDAFAAGGDLKNVFALGKENAIYLSGHFGDLAEISAAEEREKCIAKMYALFNIKPEISAADKHPSYFSAQNADLKIQHHHAHIMSVMAENQELSSKRFLGFAFDGTGYGDDGNIWGGEFFLCRGTEYKRIGSITPINMPAGDETGKNALIPAMCYIMEAEKQNILSSETANAILQRLSEKSKECMLKDIYSIMKKAVQHKINIIKSSSMGRLFDAVSAITGVCRYNTYEGECPSMLEYAADKAISSEDLKIKLYKKNDVIFADTLQLIADICRLVLSGHNAESIALGFHKVIADMVISVCDTVGCSDIAISGGTFANEILFTQTVDNLEKQGYNVYVNTKVPCGDGGIALGQIYYIGNSKQEL